MSLTRKTTDAPVSVSIAFVHGMLQGLRARGEAFETYLQDAGIAPELLDQAGARVTADQYVALFKSLAERRNDDFLGLGSRPLRRGSLALVFRAGISATTIEVAMRRAARAFGLLQDDVNLELVHDGALAGWALRFEDPARSRPPFMHELLLRGLWRWLAWLAGGKLPVARFDFAFAVPSYAGSYTSVFPAPLRFDQSRSALWFNAELLRQPVRRDESALKEFLLDAQAQVIVPRRAADDVGARLRDHLQRTQPAWPGLGDCATALHVSMATLQRRLAQEGTSFQSLKDNLRRDLAIHRLNTSAVPVAVLATELGFADSAAFQRAFKNWTGSAPGAYRRGARGDAPTAGK